MLVNFSPFVNVDIYIRGKNYFQYINCAMITNILSCAYILCTFLLQDQFNGKYWLPLLKEFIYIQIYKRI